ncbi:MAG: YlxR family protein [Kineosporiaceae bacterium]
MTGGGVQGARLTAAGYAEPQRTCVGCRRRAARSVLLRVTADLVDGVRSVVPDPGRRRPGRGAWLHLDPACLDAAERRNAFGRALRRSGRLEVALVRQYVNSTSVRAGSGSDVHEHPMSTQR